MKLFILISFSLLMLLSCKKQISNQNEPDNYFEAIKASLKSSLPAADYATLDFTTSTLTKLYNDSIYFLNIPFNGKNRETDFVLVKSDAKGGDAKARIIHLERTNTGEKDKYNGTVMIKDIKGEVLTASPIENGFIKAFHSSASSDMHKSYVLQDPYQDLPEVVIVSTYRNNDMSFSTWISLMSYYDSYGGGGGGGAGGYYGGVGGSGGAYPSGTGSGGGGTYPAGEGPTGAIVTPPMKIDFENQYADPAIDIVKYMSCFSAVPDAGARCSIEIFTDLPVDGDPTRFFDWNNGSPGHVFIQLKKSNTGKSVSQNIGFYPKSGWKTTISPAPIPGKFVDNEKHEMNASLLVNLTPAQLQAAITRVLYLGRFIRYDIDDYNCTDWALEIFNTAVKPEQKLEIVKHDIPGGEASKGTSTPQGIYLKLQQMKSAGGGLASNVSIPLVGWVGASKGPCN